MQRNGVYRIGTGAGFSADRLDPAVDLVARGNLDAIVFECLGERTLAFAYRDRAADPARGYTPLLERRMRAILPAAFERGVRVITNMGAANAPRAAALTRDIARDIGLRGLRVAYVEGDDVSDCVDAQTPLWEGTTIGGVGRSFIGAHAYLGAEALMPALESKAEVIITGRVADPSLFVAPLRHHFGWSGEDWEVLGAGTLVGHLMECAGQLTGGYFADPGYKDVADLAHLGFPIAEVRADGSAFIGKLEATGGVVDARTVREQLLYEVHDPSCYRTPDVSADFSRVRIDTVAPDRVSVAGAGGAPAPESYKLTVAFDGGYLAEAGISYAGPGAQRRAELAGRIVDERMRMVHGSNAPLRIDVIGAASLHATARRYHDDAEDVRLRCAQRASSTGEAELLLWEVESLLCCGPAGGGGYRGSITPSVITYSASLPRDRVTVRTEVLEA
ncbi:MAG: acyclic terpene utilization AtuA family protein [Gammaproteobacteria bacterium]|nr:acyclic terpene utilization AtuA family protein [Gammaproteobacteria bacterium]